MNSKKLNFSFICFEIFNRNSFNIMRDKNLFNEIRIGNIIQGNYKHEYAKVTKIFETKIEVTPFLTEGEPFLLPKKSAQIPIIPELLDNSNLFKKIAEWTYKIDGHEFIWTRIEKNGKFFAQHFTVRCFPLSSNVKNQDLEIRHLHSLQNFVADFCSDSILDVENILE